MVAVPFLATAGASAPDPDPKALLTQALADASAHKSVTISGTFSETGLAASIDGGCSASAQGGLKSISGVGVEDEIEPTGKSYVFVKASSLAVLKSALKVEKPTMSEVGVWYKVLSSDSRYDYIASPTGAQTLAQMFSYSPVGWSRNVTYGGTVTLRGTRVEKLGGSSNMWVSGSGFGKITLYVSDTATPLPIAVSGPPGTSGVIYFSKWGTTSVEIPSSDVLLPK